MPLRLTLYVMGGSHRSARAVRNLRRMIDQQQLEVDLEIVDVIEQPDRGDSDRILATPTLVRRGPGPEQRVIGDLSLPEAVERLLQPQ